MPDDLNSRLPASVTVTFPVAAHLGPDAPRVACEVTLASLALEGAPGVTGYPGTVLIRSSAVAGPGTPPANDAELLALARQAAADWYSHAVAALDQGWAGVVAWDPEGITGWLEVRQTPDGRMLTRVFSDPPGQRADLFHFSSRGAADDAPASAVLAVTGGDRSPEGYYPAEVLVWDAVALRFGAVPGVAPVWLALSAAAFAPGAGPGSGSGSGGGLGAPVPLPDSGAPVLFPGDLRVATPSAPRPDDGRTIYVALPRVFWALLTAQVGSAYSWRPLRASAAGLVWEQGTDGPADAYPANGSPDYPVGEYPFGAVVRMTLDGDHLTFEDLAVFGAAGPHHSQGAVPDPGTAPHLLPDTPPYYLGDDGEWHRFATADVVVNACLFTDPEGAPGIQLERRRVYVLDSGIATFCAAGDSPCCGPPANTACCVGFNVPDKLCLTVHVPVKADEGGTCLCIGGVWELNYVDPGPGGIPGWESGFFVCGVHFQYKFACVDCEPGISVPRFMLWLQQFEYGPSSVCSVSLPASFVSPATATQCSPFSVSGALNEHFFWSNCGGSDTLTWTVSLPDGEGNCPGAHGGSGSGSGGSGGGGGGGAAHGISCSPCGAVWPDAMYLTVSGDCPCLNGTVQMSYTDTLPGAEFGGGNGYGGVASDCPGPTPVGWSVGCRASDGKFILQLACGTDAPVQIEILGGGEICPPGGFPAGGYVFSAGQSACCPGGGNLNWSLSP